jgi:hypothetical protein
MTRHEHPDSAAVVDPERIAQIAVALEELAFDTDCSFHTWYRAGALLIDANEAGAFGRADLAGLRFDLERNLQRDGDPRFALRLVVRSLFPTAEMPREFFRHIWIEHQRQFFLQNWAPKLASWLRGQVEDKTVETGPPVELLVALKGYSQKILVYLWDRHIVEREEFQRDVWKGKANTPDADRKAVDRLKEALYRLRTDPKLRPYSEIRVEVTQTHAVLTRPDNSGQK